MASLVDEAEQNSKEPDDDAFIWEWQTNDNPWDKTQTAVFTSFPHNISSVIDEAYQRGCKNVFINENYLIDFQHHVQQCINDPYRQRPVRRRRRWYRLLDSISAGSESSFHQRLSFPLRVSRCSATGDTSFYGSSFIQLWLMIFTKGKMKITFDTIYPVLVEGLKKEGQIEPPEIWADIELVLIEVEKKTYGKSFNERIKDLQICCAKLYTYDCYIYKAVNTALRDDDRSKLYNLGPFCYLLFNYVGQRSMHKSSINERLQQIFHSHDTEMMTLYRADRNVDNIVEEYQQAAGDNSKFFKWRPFVSTSRDRAVAEQFPHDVLYIIEMRSYPSNTNQFSNLTCISRYPKEKEILLLPGVQFQVTKLEFDTQKRRHLIYIRNRSSYIHNLQ